MSQRCYEIEELGTLTELPADNPQLRHLEACARCRARFAAYRDFMDPGELPPEAQADSANARLTAALEREAALHPPTPTRRRFSPFERLIAILKRPALVPAWGLMVGLAIVLIWQYAGEGPQSPDDPSVLRGNEATHGAVILAADAEILSDGTILFAWEAHAGCEAYQILLFGADLTELRTLDAGSAAQVSLDLGEIDAHYWRVIGLQAGARTAQSSLKTLTAE